MMKVDVKAVDVARGQEEKETRYVGAKPNRNSQRKGTIF